MMSREKPYSLESPLDTEKIERDTLCLKCLRENIHCTLQAMKCYYVTAGFTHS